MTLGEEVRRRLRNTDRHHSETDLVGILTTFSQKLIDSQYDTLSRQEVLKSGIRKYFREMASAVKAGNSLYRTRKEMDGKKEIMSLMNKPWFRRMRGGNQAKLVKEGLDKYEARLEVRRDLVSEKEVIKGPEISVENHESGHIKEIECVVFVPATPGSVLRSILQEKDDMLARVMRSPALRFVDEGGETVMDRLGQSDP